MGNVKVKTKFKVGQVYYNISNNLLGVVSGKMTYGIALLDSNDGYLCLIGPTSSNWVLVGNL